MPWAYHSTSRRRLPSIRRRGLIPQRQPPEHSDEQRGALGTVIFFSPTRQLAEEWGEVLLRFPWPEDAQEDPYGDAFLLRGSLTYSNWYTESPVPLEEIEFYDRGVWRQLISPRHGQP